MLSKLRRIQALPLGRRFSVLGGVSEDLLVSTSIGHQIGGDNHASLVSSLVKTGVVPANSRLESAFNKVDRALFVPKDRQDEAYANKPLRIGVVATISTPQQHAQVLQLLEPHLQPGSKALDIGSGSGILVAIMSHLVGTSGHVLGLDIVPELVDLANTNVKACLPSELASSVTIKESSGKQVDIQGEYDAIHVGVAVETKDEAEKFLEYLKPGGALLVPLGFGGAEQKLVKMTKDMDGHVDKKDVMSVLCQPILDAAPEAEPEQETRSEKLERLQSELSSWRAAFEQEHGKRPTRDDMMADPIAKDLFMDFSKLRK